MDLSSDSDDCMPPSKRHRSDTVESSSNHSNLSESDKNEDLPSDQIEAVRKRSVTYTDSNSGDDSYPDHMPQFSGSQKIRCDNSDIPGYHSYYGNYAAEKISKGVSSSDGNYGNSSHTENSEDEYGVGRISTDSQQSNKDSCLNDEVNDHFVEPKSNSVPVIDDHTSVYSNVSQRMMMKMGHKKGEGLGKSGTGLVEPIQASTHKGRRGLGIISELGPLPKDFKWTPEEDVFDFKEEKNFIPGAPKTPLSKSTLNQWMVKGAKKLTIDDEIHFVEPTILHGVLNSKTIFDKLLDEDLRKARYRSNPFETIGNVCFLNRAAVKMANIDAVFDFQFTEPKDASNKPILKPDELLYFADVCAGPGGFSEYVLFRKKWKAKGFGFTLKGPNDFKVDDFLAGPPETFCCYYGKEEDGDIFKPTNLTSLKEFVFEHTDGLGVHFLMADGGFSVEAQENIQEILSKELYLCQCLAALMLVREGGHFVVKLFDIFTPFSVGLIYIMYRCFDNVCIIKPVTSRPANSERYLVCLNKRDNTDDCEKHLFEVNEYLFRNQNTDKDITLLVPLDVLRKDKAFFDYVFRSNCSLGKKQILNLLKIAAFCEDTKLVENRQAEMKQKCLNYWKLTDEVRKQPNKQPPDGALCDILYSLIPPYDKISDLKKFITHTLGKRADEFEYDKIFKPLQRHAYYFKYISKVQECKFYLGMGGKSVFQVNEGAEKWEAVPKKENSAIVNLPAKTLIYGEIVCERTGEGSGQIRKNVFYIVDAICLGGTPISHMSIIERQKQCKIFCKALENIGDRGVLQLKCKDLHPSANFEEIVKNLEIRKLKQGGRAVLAFNFAEEFSSKVQFFEVEAILFYRTIKESWNIEQSRQTGKLYYYKKDVPSIFDLTGQNVLNAIDAHKKRQLWPWNIEVFQKFEKKCLDNK